MWTEFHLPSTVLYPESKPSTFNALTVAHSQILCSAVSKKFQVPPSSSLLRGDPLELTGREASRRTRCAHGKLGGFTPKSTHRAQQLEGWEITLCPAGARPIGDSGMGFRVDQQWLTRGQDPRTRCAQKTHPRRSCANAPFPLPHSALPAATGSAHRSVAQLLREPPGTKDAQGGSGWAARTSGQLTMEGGDCLARRGLFGERWRLSA